MNSEGRLYKNLCAKLSHEKAASEMLMKLTPQRFFFFSLLDLQSSFLPDKIENKTESNFYSAGKKRVEKT